MAMEEGRGRYRKEEEGAVEEKEEGRTGSNGGRGGKEDKAYCNLQHMVAVANDNTKEVDNVEWQRRLVIPCAPRIEKRAREWMVAAAHGSALPMYGEGHSHS